VTTVLKRVYMIHPRYWCAARPIAEAQHLLEKDGFRVCSWLRWALTVCVEWLREWWMIAYADLKAAIAKAREGKS
jgi:hypothetical protein